MKKKHIERIDKNRIISYNVARYNCCLELLRLSKENRGKEVKCDEHCWFNRKCEDYFLLKKGNPLYRKR